MTGNQEPFVPRCRELSKPSHICKDPSECADRVLVIVGASARAAAESARLGGFAPAAADQFGDRDLLKAGIWTPIQDYPLNAVSAVARLPNGPWLYTGGLENLPDVVDDIAAKRPLLGNPGRVLRAVRDPFHLADVLQRHGLCMPKIQSRIPSTGAIGQWLRKPLRGCGGRGIHVVHPAARDQSVAAPHPDEMVADPDDRQCFYQQWIDGSSYSGVFLAAQGNALLIGATRQLVGRPWTMAPRFAYCGSIWPSGLDRRMMRELAQVGQCLAANYGLTGLFGVDVIVADGRMFVLEVNPRYSASSEVLEPTLTTGESIVALHVAACEQHVLPQPAPSPEDHRTCLGKAILFADCLVSVGPRFDSLLEQVDTDGRWSPLADIPAPGTIINAGQPIATVRAQAESPTVVLRRLKRLANQVRSALDAPR